MAVKEYLVNMLVDATVPKKIKAKSAEEAAEKAYDTTECPTLCHHCSDNLEVGDIIGVLVSSGEGNEEYDDTYAGGLTRQISALNDVINDLRAENTKLKEEEDILGQVVKMLEKWHRKRAKKGLRPLTQGSVVDGIADILAKFDAQEWALSVIKQDEMKGLKKPKDSPETQFLHKLGACSVCLQVPEHHLDEPFATCACGTGEDLGRDPLQRAQRVEAAAKALADACPNVKAWHAYEKLQHLNAVLAEESK